MLCPQCKVELRIKRSYTEIKDGRVQTVQELHCVNRECPLCSSVVPVKVLVHPHEENHVDKLISCTNCSTPLARETKEGYIFHDNADVKDGIVICPLCNTAVTIS